MDFKTFLRTNLIETFCISATGICVLMAVIGMSFAADTRFGYEAFLSPLIFAALATLPSLVHYSKEELSFKQSIIRQIIHFVLLEIVVLSLLAFNDQIKSLRMGFALALAILLVDLTVNLVLWISAQRTAREINIALKILQGKGHKL